MSARQELDHIIKGYSNDSPGSRFVKRGEYQVLRTEDSRIIRRSEFDFTVKAGMKLEISIIIRRGAALQKSCPVCRQGNLNDNRPNGWIEWKVPPNFYRCLYLIPSITVADARNNSELQKPTERLIKWLMKKLMKRSMTLKLKR